MSFYSLKFAIFFLAVFSAAWLCAARRRWLVLLASSLVFYGLFGAQALIFLLGVGLFTFVLGRVLGRATTRRRGILLAAGIALLSGLLLFLKFSIPAAQALGWRGVWRVALPVGLSFYLFQAMAYLIDIFLDKLAPEKHFGRYMLSLAFFPKLLQGPIERGAALLPQLREPAAWNQARAWDGLCSIITGLFLKAVLADRLAPLVDARFTGAQNGALLGAYAYALQLYLDFAGYTRIAIGMGKLLGIELSENFDKPFAAETIPDFWRRWHMTLSSWLRDYLFMPLAVIWRDWGTASVVMACLITFLICGLWHGAGWNYLAFGALHGIYMASSLLTLKSRDAFIKRHGLPRQFIAALRKIVTFHLVAFSFIFFRCATWPEAMAFIARLGEGLNLPALPRMYGPIELAALGVGLTAFIARERLRAWSARHAELRFAMLANAVIFLGVKSDAPFIYFQF